MRRNAAEKYLTQYESTKIKRRRRTDKELWYSLLAMAAIAAVLLAMTILRFRKSLE